MYQHLYAFGVWIITIGSILLVPSWLQAGEETREFEEQKCRFTLPNGDWSWRELSGLYKDDGVLFIAKNRGELQLMLTVEKNSTGKALNQQTMDELEQELRSEFDFIKRGSHFLTFTGLPCYQLEILGNGQKTAANRVFFAHGFCYLLCARGGKNAVELDPEYEKAMAGFEFTVPPTQEPVPVRQAPPPQRDVSFRAGQIAGICTLLAITLLFVCKACGRKNNAA